MSEFIGETNTGVEVNIYARAGGYRGVQITGGGVYLQMCRGDCVELIDLLLKAIEKIKQKDDF